MKRVLYFLSGTVCLLIAIAFILLFSDTVGLTASSYITTANQYGKVQTTVPAILNGEVNISFYNGSLPKTTEYDTDNTVYVESSYSSSSSSKTYAMKIDDVGLVSGSTNVYGLTDYYDTPITDSSIDLLKFVDFFGAVKSSGDYGSLKNTAASETYTMPLVTEKSVGNTPDGDGDGYTTLNITPFKERVQVTVYFTMRTTNNAGTARSDPYYAFYFNGEEIYYNNDTQECSAGVTKSTYNNTNECYELGDYTFTAGDNTSSNKSISTHQLYSYTTVLDAETATNIMTGTDNQTMIFLIVLTPYTPIALVDNNGNISGTVAGNGVQELTVSYDASKAYTITATVASSGVSAESSNTSVATIGAISEVTAGEKYTVNVTPVGVGTTTITVAITNSAGEKYSKEYTLTVENSLTLANSYTITSKGNTSTINLGFAFTVSGTVSYAVSSSDTSVAAASESGGTVTVTGVSPGSAEITVTATVDGTNYTSTTTVYVDGYEIQEENQATSVYKGNTLELSLYAVNGAVAGSASTGLSVSWSSSDTSVATVNGGTVTGVAAGDVTITATIDGVSYTYRLTVLEPKIKIANEYIITGTTAESTVNVTYDVITYDNIESGEISVTDSAGATASGITATVSSDGLVITTSSAATGVYKVTITDSDTGASDYVYVIVGTEETNNVSYTATYTINSSANGATGESAFDVSVVDGSGIAATDSSGAITVSGGGSNGIAYSSDNKTYTGYSGYSEFKTSRYAIITVDDAASISKITVYASASNTSRILYITTSVPSSSTPDSDAIKASGSSTGDTFNISASSLSGGTYYVWATDTIKVYAIVIEYTVEETTVNISSVSTSTTGITTGNSSTITCTAGAEVISLNTNIATVTEDGGTVTITGVAAGTTYILVNDNGELKLYAVTVTDPSG